MPSPRRLFVGAIAALCISSCAAAPPSVRGGAQPTIAPPAPAPAPAIAPLASKIAPIFAAYDKPDAPGCAVGVYRAGELLYAHGYGLANLEHRIPITPDTAFNVGSVAKQFTAMATLLLVQDGRLSLDDDVRKYVPELPDYGKPITLRHLLHHTSGLRDYGAALGMTFNTTDVTYDDDGLFAVVHQKTLDFPTGSKWSYSNTGYYLLSFVVRRVSGKTLAAFAKERIFDPLGMKDTLYADEHRRVIPRIATSYQVAEGGGFLVSAGNWEQVGDGGVVTTIRDLARWDANFYEPKVGSAATLALLRTPGKLDDGTQLTYAMGLYETTENGVAVEEHSGYWLDYRAHILRLPSERLTAACLCNGLVDPRAVTRDVVATFVPKLAGALPSGTPSADAPAPNHPSVSPAQLAPAVGTYYDSESFAVRTLSIDKGALSLGFQLDGAGDHRLLDAIDARTFVRGTTVYRFEPAAKGHPAHLVRTSPDADPLTLVSVTPATPTPAQLAEYAGRYTSEEVTADMDVRPIDGGAKLGIGTWRRGVADVLVPLDHDLFLFGGGGFRFQRDGRGRLRGFLLNRGERGSDMQWVRVEDPPSGEKSTRAASPR